MLELRRDGTGVNNATVWHYSVPYPSTAARQGDREAVDEESKYRSQTGVFLTVSSNKRERSVGTAHFARRSVFSDCPFQTVTAYKRKHLIRQPTAATFPKGKAWYALALAVS